MIDLKAIQDEQNAYFEAKIGINPDGSDMKNCEYKQVIPLTENDVRVDIYDGASGKGYVVIETKIEDGKTLQKFTNFGPEEYRTKDWA